MVVAATPEILPQVQEPGFDLAWGRGKGVGAQAVGQEGESEIGCGVFGEVFDVARARKEAAAGREDDAVDANGPGFGGVGAGARVPGVGDGAVLFDEGGGFVGAGVGGVGSEVVGVGGGEGGEAGGFVVVLGERGEGVGSAVVVGVFGGLDGHGWVGFCGGVVVCEGRWMGFLVSCGSGGVFCCLCVVGNKESEQNKDVVQNNQENGETVVEYHDVFEYLDFFIHSSFLRRFLVFHMICDGS